MAPAAPTDAVEARGPAVMDHVHAGRDQAEGDARACAEHERAVCHHRRLAQRHGRRGLHAQRRARGAGRALRRGCRGEAQATRAALDPGEGRDGRRVDGQHRRAAAPHRVSRAWAILYAVRLCRENSSMNPGAAPCANEASALNVARLRS